MIRPTIRLSDEFGAVLKYHCAKEGKSMNQYIAELIYEEMSKRQEQLMRDISRETILV